MNYYADNHYYNTRRSGGGIVIGAIVALILAAGVFAAMFIATKNKALNQQIESDRETIVPNISANMIYAIDPSIIQNYRAAHDIDAKQSLYSYSPANAFTDPAHVNTDITEEVLGSVTSLVLDMKQNNDLSALSYCKNLRFLRVTHAEFLTDADIAVMNTLTGLAEVEFVFDRNDITNMQKFADLTQCACADKKILLMNGDFENENTAYAIYHLFGKYYPSVPCDGLNYDFYKQLDDKLQTLIDKVDFTNCKDDKDRLLKCMTVVMKHLYYDDEISDYSQVNDDIYEGTYIYNKVVKYNDCQLSSNLLIDGDRGYGCCTNFTSLLLAVCVKLDIEAYMVDGKRSNDVGFLHDWIYAPADGSFYCLDMTETNRWFKRSAGMFHRYNAIVIEGDKDIMYDPDFYASFKKQVFETYNDFILKNYVFFVSVDDIVPKIDTARAALVYNAAAGPVEKYIMTNANDSASAQAAAVKSGAAAGVAALAVGLAAVFLIDRRRRL